MATRNTGNKSPLPPISTYLSLPTKIVCPNSTCGKDLYYYPPTQINDVKTPILLSCASCKHTFATTDAELPKEEISSVSIKETHYDVLGLDKNATVEDISRAYRKKSLQCHPDRITGREQEWERLTKAYEVLGDKRKKYWYDVELEKGLSGGDTSDDVTSQGTLS